MNQPINQSVNQYTESTNTKQKLINRLLTFAIDEQLKLVLMCRNDLFLPKQLVNEDPLFAITVMAMSKPLNPRLLQEDCQCNNAPLTRLF